MSKYYTQGAGRQESPDDDFTDRLSGMDSRQNLTQNRGGGGYYEEPYHGQGSANQGFDVRADFDGDGPRWSEMYGAAKHETYRPVYDHDVDEPGHIGTMRPHMNQMHKDPEMVSVPVLGAEWTKDELTRQTNRGKKRALRDDRKDDFRAWNRDQKGCCGIPWMTRTVFVFISFFFIAALIITLYFVIPRTVAFTWYNEDCMSVDTETQNFNRVPTNFSFDAELHLFANTMDSWIPVAFYGADAKVFDASTSALIATGHMGKFSLKRDQKIPFRFPVTFSYSALNMSDVTWNNVYSACRFPETGVERTGLNWRVEIKQHIIGMVPKPTIQASIIGAPCTFNISKTV